MSDRVILESNTLEYLTEEIKILNGQIEWLKARNEKLERVREVANIYLHVITPSNWTSLNKALKDCEGEA